MLGVNRYNQALEQAAQNFKGSVYNTQTAGFINDEGGDEDEEFNHTMTNIGGAHPGLNISQPTVENDEDLIEEGLI